MQGEERVILVNEQDEELGTEEKLQAHKLGLLHRAFSIFIFNGEGQMLLQRRSFSKYHSGGLWTNTCCSHPRQKESVEDAAHRRLQEEMGFDCKLFTLFTFIYQGVLDKGLQEHELDHVLYGIYSGDVIPDSEEVSAYRWVGTQEIIQEVQKYPEKFTIWFQLSLNRVLSSF